MKPSMTERRASQATQPALNPPQESGDAGRIRNLQQRRFQAMIAGDVAALDEILADDVVYTHASGEVETKQQFLESVASHRIEYQSLEASEVTVRVFGTAAVITGRGSMEIRRAGQGKSFAFRFIEVYANRDGRWQMAAWQSTRLPDEGKD